MQHIKSIKTTALIEGLVKNVVVTIEIDNDDVDFSYWDESLAKETALDLERGAVSCVWVNVRASFSDLAHFEGQDSLGQVILRGSHDAAMRDLKQTVKIHGMVKTAIDDLITNVLNGKSQIDTFLTKAA